MLRGLGNWYGQGNLMDGCGMVQGHKTLQMQRDGLGKRQIFCPEGLGLSLRGATVMRLG